MSRLAGSCVECQKENCTGGQATRVVGSFLDQQELHMYCQTGASTGSHLDLQVDRLVIRHSSF